MYTNLHRINSAGKVRTVAVFSPDGQITSTSKLMPVGTQTEEELYADWRTIVTSVIGIKNIAVTVVRLKCSKILSATVTTDDGDVYIIEVDTSPNSHYKLDFADEINISR